MHIKINYPLKNFNTFGIALNAPFFSSFTDEQELLSLLNYVKAGQKEVLILGGGSNVLFTKQPQDWILKNEIKHFEIAEDSKDYAIVKSGAGNIWHEFVLETLKHNLFGLENLSLIPGCVGAAPMQNIGAYGVEIKSTFHHLDAIEIATMKNVSFNNQECKFGYRESVFKNIYKKKYVITHVYFKLSKIFQANIEYGAIKEQLTAMGIEKPTAKDVSNAVIAIRQSKLPDPKVLGNAGSFFKNPTISNEQFLPLKEKFPNMVSYPVANNEVKIAAGWLIEQCGLKGFRENDYGVHKNQALVLVNYGNASGSEIFQLSEMVIENVKSKFGITLEREVNIY